MFHDTFEVELGLDISDVTSWKNFRVIPLANETSPVASTTWELVTKCDLLWEDVY